MVEFEFERKLEFRATKTQAAARFQPSRVVPLGFAEWL